MDLPHRLLVVGQGYVGLPLAVRAVEAGFDVVGFDVRSDRVEGLAAGRSHVEDVSDERLAACLATGRYRPVDALDPLTALDADPVDVVVVSVPTPLRDGAPDLAHIEQAGAAVAPLLRPGATVILESTTYPGTTEELLAPILEAGSGLRAGADFHLGYSPERIDPGNRTFRFENTPKVVSGTTTAGLAAVEAFYGRLVETTVAVGSTRTAELTKLLENTFRHVNIALVNELAMFADDLGADVWEAIDAATTKPFGYLRFTPGPGVGGHCLPVDPSYLSWQVRRRTGSSFRFVELANDVNAHMPDHVVARVVAMLNDRELAVRGRRILLLGLAYKANTGDARETPARPIAERLVDLGATVVATDPHVAPEEFPAGVAPVPCTPNELAAADLVVVLVPHDAFDLDAVRTHARAVFDTRNVVGAAAHVEVL